MALAVAKQMAGQNKQAISVVDAFVGTQDVKARTRDYGTTIVLHHRGLLHTATAATSVTCCSNRRRRRRRRRRHYPRQMRAS